MSKNVNLIKSDISNLFQELETIATETKLEEKKKRGYVEPSVSDISNLFEGLEEASRQAKELSSEDTEKLGAFSGLMEQMTTITKKVEDDVTTQINEVVTEFVEEEITHEEEDELREFAEEKTEQPPEKSTDIIEKIVDNLDEMRYSTEVKEELDQIEALRKEFEQYKTALQNQVTKGLATSSGGGEVRLEFLDDVDRDTAKVNGKFLKFDSSSGKFVGADANPSTESIQDIIGDMVSSNTESGITVTYQDGDGTLDFTVGTLNQDTTGNAATATALATARTIHGVSFDGSANIDLSEVIQDTVGAMFGSNTETGITVTYQDSDGTIDLVVGTLNQDTTGNAATATALATARNIGGVSFDGTANINLPGVNTSGDQDTSGNAATATALATARTINGTSFDGTANVTVTAAAGTVTGNTLNSGVTASSLTSVGTLTTLTVDNIVVNGTTIGHTDDTDLITLADGVVTVAGEISVTTLDIGGTNVTSTAAELNILDGVTSTATELNIMDGNTSASSTTVADADRVVFNDAGTMKQVAVTDLAAYFDDEITAMPNLITTAATTVGALDSGSITSGFGTIDTGSSTITTTGLITGGSLDIDDVVINGTTIGHTDDTDLLTVANGLLTVAGEISVTTLDIGGTNVTSTAAELNLLDGVSGLVQADFTKLAAVDSTAAELNIVDGGTSATSTTLADADRVVVNDNGTMVQVALTDFETYFESALDTLSNVTTVGALNSGSITSGFGAIDNGSSAITTTGTITGGSLDISGNADIDGVTNLDNTDIDGTLVVDGSNISLDSTSTLNIDNSNTSNGITIGTATSGVPVSIGHTTSETTVNDNMTVTGTMTQTGVSTSTAKDIFNAGMSIKNGATSAGFVEFFEDSDNGTNKVTLIGPSSTADVTLTLPNAAGTVATTDDATALAIALG